MPEQVRDSKQRTRTPPARLRWTCGLLRAATLILAGASVDFADNAYAQHGGSHRHFYLIETRAPAPGRTLEDATTAPFAFTLIAASLAILAHLLRSTGPKRTRKRPIATV